MVAGSSLRRPPQSIHQPEREANNAQEHPSLPLRSKRIRTITLSDQGQDNKRRRIAAKQPQPLRIPLRGKTPVLQLRADPSPGKSTRFIDLPTPTGKPQYDQIRLIEEKARKAAYHQDGAEDAGQDEQRKLRKHGGMRSNTELSNYFSKFEEMLSLVPPDPEALTSRTKVILVDDTPNYEPPAPRLDPFGSRQPLHNTTIVDLPVPKTVKRATMEDPMNEEVYMKTHRRAERHEKLMKNGDRERSAHEKYQLERLLEDLRGPDWLKTLGVSGITETEKKRYEPKRLLFIRETRAIIDKFRWWKEEEKRRKEEREEQLRVEAAEAEAGEQESASQRSVSTQPPNSSEIDALASQQLLEEVKSANKRKKTTTQEVLLPLPIYKSFISFFEKRHLRDAAVSGRQRGRTVLAFGCSLPDLEEQEFCLPDSILTEDAIRSSQRSRRRRRRDIDE